MKHLKQFAGKLLVLTSAMGLGAAWAASPSTAVFQRTTNTESVELSNLDDADSSQVEVSTTPLAPSAAGASNTQPVVAARSPVDATRLAKAPQQIKKKIRLADGSEEEVWVDTDQEATDLANEAGVGTTEGTRGAGAGAGGYSGFNAAGGSYGGYSGGTSGGSVTAGYTGAGASAAGTGSNTSNSSGAGSTTVAGSGSTNTGNTVAGTGSSIGSIGSTGGLGGTGGTGSKVASGGATGAAALPSPTPTTALETKLETYRNMMLTEVGNAQVSNPAIARRYQMVNKSTYQILMGL